MFNVVVLLAGCATLALAAPTVRDYRTEDDEIYAILKKLFEATVPLEAFIKNPAGNSPKEVIMDAFEYAYHYWEVLDVGVAEPSIVYRQHSSHLFWNPISFQQRVCNFGWEKLPAPQQYHAMGKVLVELLKCVQRRWGGRPVLMEVERSNGLYLGITTTDMISNLESDIKELCRVYKFDDVPPPGPPL